MLVGKKMLFWQRERVLVLINEPESDGLGCMMLNIKNDIECVYLHLLIHVRHVGRMMDKIFNYDYRGYSLIESCFLQFVLK